MSRVNAGVSQIPSNHQMVQNIRNPYPTVVSNYSHPPSKLPAEYGFETPSRSLVTFVKLVIYKSYLNSMDCHIMPSSVE